MLIWVQSHLSLVVVGPLPNLDDSDKSTTADSKSGPCGWTAEKIAESVPDARVLSFHVCLEDFSLQTLDPAAELARISMVLLQTLTDKRTEKVVFCSPHPGLMEQKHRLTDMPQKRPIAFMSRGIGGLLTRKASRTTFGLLHCP